jgi:hypothetical protein
MTNLAASSICASMLLAACAVEPGDGDDNQPMALACDDDWYFCDVSYRFPGEDIGFVLSHEGAFTASVGCEGCEMPYRVDPTQVLQDRATFGATTGDAGDFVVTADITDAVTGEVESSTLAYEVREPDRLTAQRCDDGEVPYWVDEFYVAFVAHAEDLARPVFSEPSEYPSWFTTRDLSFLDDEVGRGWVAAYYDHPLGPLEVTGRWGDLEATARFTIY